MNLTQYLPRWRPLDLITRFKALKTRGLLSPGFGLLFFGISIWQSALFFLPLVGWLLWPVWVYTALQVTQDPQVNWRQILPSWVHRCIALAKRPLTLYTLFLYGVLNLIVFRGLSEGSKLLPSVSALIPGACGSLLPFTFSEATATLLTAACASHLLADEVDVLQVLSRSVMNLVLSPVSWFILALFYAFPVTGLVTDLAVGWQLPPLASAFGHGALAGLSIIWVCGAASSSKN